MLSVNPSALSFPIVFVFRLFQPRKAPMHTKSHGHLGQKHRNIWSFSLFLCLIGAIFLLPGWRTPLRFAPRAPYEHKTAAFGPAQRPSCQPTWSPPEKTDVWNLVLVNPWTPLSQDHTLSLTQLEGSQSVDSRCAQPLQEMLDACRAEGLSPVICSSYRTQETQETLYRNQIKELRRQGYSTVQAEELAATMVAVPGTSEHQLGLAVDIVDQNYQILESSQENTPVQQWLMEHCWEYGFILRYPNEKSSLTGIIYEPWHYRYVGIQAAKEITQAGICLEEYLGAAAQSNGNEGA